MRAPLPANSRLLRDRRYEAWVGGPKNERGARPMIAEGRFQTSEDARTWADEAYPDAPTVTITFFSARSGWVPQASDVRRDGEWVAR
jgi:hypothetical protein